MLLLRHSLNFESKQLLKASQETRQRGGREFLELKQVLITANKEERLPKLDMRPLRPKAQRYI